MDWKKLIAELAESGLTQSQIAEACGTTQSTVSDLARLDERGCTFELGSKLVALHKARTAVVLKD